MPQGLYEQQGNNVTKQLYSLYNYLPLEIISSHTGQLSVFKGHIQTAPKYGCDHSFKWLKRIFSLQSHWLLFQYCSFAYHLTICCCGNIFYSLPYFYHLVNFNFLIAIVLFTKIIKWKRITLYSYNVTQPLKFIKTVLTTSFMSVI